MPPRRVDNKQICELWNPLSKLDCRVHSELCHVLRSGGDVGDVRGPDVIKHAILFQNTFIKQNAVPIPMETSYDWNYLNYIKLIKKYDWEVLSYHCMLTLQHTDISAELITMSQEIPKVNLSNQKDLLRLVSVSDSSWSKYFSDLNSIDGGHVKDFVELSIYEYFNKAKIRIEKGDNSDVDLQLWNSSLHLSIYPERVNTILPVAILTKNYECWLTTIEELRLHNKHSNVTDAVLLNLNYIKQSKNETLLGMYLSWVVSLLSNGFINRISDSLIDELGTSFSLSPQLNFDNINIDTTNTHIHNTLTLSRLQSDKRGPYTSSIIGVYLQDPNIFINSMIRNMTTNKALITAYIEVIKLLAPVMQESSKVLFENSILSGSTSCDDQRVLMCLLNNKVIEENHLTSPCKKDNVTLSAVSVITFWKLCKPTVFLCEQAFQIWENRWFNHDLLRHIDNYEILTILEETITFMCKWISEEREKPLKRIKTNSNEGTIPTKSTFSWEIEAIINQQYNVRENENIKINKKRRQSVDDDDFDIENKILPQSVCLILNIDLQEETSEYPIPLRLVTDILLSLMYLEVDSILFKDLVELFSWNTADKSSSWAVPMGTTDVSNKIRLLCEGLIIVIQYSGSNLRDKLIKKILPKICDELRNVSQDNQITLCEILIRLLIISSTYYELLLQQMQYTFSDGIDARGDTGRVITLLTNYIVSEFKVLTESNYICPLQSLSACVVTAGSSDELVFCSILTRCVDELIENVSLNAGIIEVLRLTLSEQQREDKVSEAGFLIVKYIEKITTPLKKEEGIDTSKGQTKSSISSQDN